MKKPFILVVDDNKITTKLISFSLNAVGFLDSPINLPTFGID